MLGLFVAFFVGGQRKISIISFMIVSMPGYVELYQNLFDVSFTSQTSVYGMIEKIPSPSFTD